MTARSSPPLAPSPAPVSRRSETLLGSILPVLRFVEEGPYARLAGTPDVCDFVFGNPHEMPLPGLVDALARWAQPRDPSWFAYRMNDEPAREAVVAALGRDHGLAYQAEDVFLTTGAFAALAVALAAVVDPGDEVAYISPPWFFYETLILAAGATPVAVPMDPVTFDLDVDAIAAALTPRTRALIVNSPHNPTGRIYPAETLERLAAVLAAAAERFGRPVYVLSDEAYRRIRFDGRPYHSPAASHPHTLVIYTYGKVLLAPAERLGYIALPSAMPGREALRGAITACQLAAGWAWPNATLQYALPELEHQSIDIGALQRRRDRLTAALRAMGYQATTPEGTFYVVVRSPDPDDAAFCDRLAAHGVLALPGHVFGMPGTFRLSLTASDAMVERSLAGFEAALGA